MPSTLSLKNYFVHALYVRKSSFSYTRVKFTRVFCFERALRWWRQCWPHQRENMFAWTSRLSRYLLNFSKLYIPFATKLCHRLLRWPHTNALRSLFRKHIRVFLLIYIVSCRVYSHTAAVYVANIGKSYVQPKLLAWWFKNYRWHCTHRRASPCLPATDGLLRSRVVSFCGYAQLHEWHAFFEVLAWKTAVVQLCIHHS